MQKVSKILILLIGIFASSPVLGSSCFELIEQIFKKKSHPRQFDHDAIDLLNKIEGQSNWFRGNKLNPKVELNLRIEEEIVGMDSFILNNEFAVVVREWRPLIRKVEFASGFMKRYQFLVEVLEKSADNFDRIAVTKLLREKEFGDEFIEIFLNRIDQKGRLAVILEYKKLHKKYAIQLGQNYHHYRLVIDHLEELLAKDSCDAYCRKNIKFLISKMGVDSSIDEKRFPILLKGMHKMQKSEIYDILYRSQVADLTRAKLERNWNVFAFFRDIATEILLYNKIRSLLINNKYVGEFFEAFLNSREIRRLYFPHINKIMRSTKTTENKLKMLISANALPDLTRDKLLKIYSQRVDDGTRKSWLAMKELAEKNDHEFFQRMLAQEELGKGRELTLLHKKTLAARIGYAIGALGSGYAVYYMATDGKKEILEQIEDLGITKEQLENGEVIIIEPGGQDDKDTEALMEELEQLGVKIKGIDRGPSSEKSPWWKFW
ncbi:MAG: hypothetical protein HN509_00795 [Halobacteriovoraceae bacterium]|nr:hypothetical protein [Halobacteriovoraceae bacterium]MBT5094822.1 hypothetical protein [Halobacteriovoraceae bacterium]